MLRKLLLVAALLAVTTGSALADEEKTLTIGDAAPAIDIAHWVKGVDMDRRGNFTPVTEFESGKIYVLEFWATWCGPCVGNMPHLSELQEQFEDKGVRIIGVSNETLPKVISFLFQTDRGDGKLHNDRSLYTLTTDPDGSVHADYMQAANQQGIPTAFVIGKDSKVEWIGHPSQLDDVLAQLVEDKWDREAYKAEFEQEAKLQAALQEAQPRLMQAAMAEDWDGVLKVFDELLVVAPDHLGIKMQKLSVLLTKFDDKEKAYAYADAVSKAGWDEAMLLNAMAWTILDNPEVLHRDFDFALKIAERAKEVSEAKDAAILDTLARAYFEKKDLEKAVEWQTKAVELATEGKMKADLEKNLEKYKAALPAKAQ